MTNTVLKRLITGSKRRPRRVLLSVFFGVTSLWAILEPLLALTGVKVDGSWQLLAFLAISLIIASIRVFPPSSIRFALRNTNTKVVVKFGDLFAEPIVAIGVTEYFDSELGDLVSSASLHGALIQNVLGGNAMLFDTAVDNSLKGISFEPTERSKGKTKAYPIGTTASLEFGKQHFLLCALARADADHVASTTPALLVEALSGLWQKARTITNGRPVAVPLVGTGLAKAGLPPMRVLELILISILYETKRLEFAPEVRIVIAEHMFEEIDLLTIQHYWS